MWTIFSIVLFLSGIITFLYTPMAQDALTDALVRRLNASGDVHIEIGRFRLAFPLKVEIDDLTVIERGNDTLVAANGFTADVKLLPLLNGNVNVKNAVLYGGRYRIGTPDSAMYLVADIDHLALNDGCVDLSGSVVDLKNTIIDGGRIDLVLKNDTTPSPPDTTTTPWRLKLRDVELRNVTYRMSMLPVIDSMNVYFDNARLKNGGIDLARQKVTVSSLKGVGLDAAYIFPDTSYLAQHPELFYVPEVEADTIAGKPWEIIVDTIDFTRSTALYAMRGAVPLPGIDFNYINVDSLDLAITSFYNGGAVTRIPITWLSGHERSGVDLTGSGVVKVDDVALTIEDFEIKTPDTKLNFDLMMGLGDLLTDVSLPVSFLCSGGVGISDFKKLFPDYMIFNGIPADETAIINADISGRMGDLDITEVYLELKRRLDVKLSGNVQNLTAPEDISGTISLTGSLGNVEFLTRDALDPETLTIPPMRLSGIVEMSGGKIGGQVEATTSSGGIAMDAEWRSRGEAYRLDLETDSFPVNAFLPLLGVGKITGTLNAEGEGLDITAETTRADVNAMIAQVEYEGYDYTNVRVWATIAGGNAELGLLSYNDDIDMDITASGNLGGDFYDWSVAGDIRALDLRAIGLSDETSHGSITFDLHGVTNIDIDSVDVNLDIETVEWFMGEGEFVADNVNMRLCAEDSMTVATLNNHDLAFSFESPLSLDSLSMAMTATMTEIDRQMSELNIDVDTLQQIIPRFDLTIKSGNDNMLTDYLAANDVSIEALNMGMSNEDRLRLYGELTGFKSGETRLDDVVIDIGQRGKFLVYRIDVDNERGTFDKFASVGINGYIAGDKLSIFVNQADIDGNIGYKLGAVANISDSVFTLRFVPYTPRVAYKDWTINEDNFVSYDMAHHHIDANLDMRSAESSLQLYAEHIDSVEHQEDIILKVTDFKIADWIAVNPYAPPMKGLLSADMRLGLGEGAFNGNGIVSVKELYYGKERVGSFVADVGLTTDVTGMMRATASLMVDSVKTVTLSGNLNDSTSTSPFMLDFSMIHFPLRVLNPFMPPGSAELNGMLNGEIEITGDAASPVFNGTIDFDSAAIKIPMIGTTFGLSKVAIPVENSVIKFNDFAIRGVNENALMVNGIVDMSDMTTPAMDLSLVAKNMQIVGSEKTKRSDVYGKAYIDLDTKINGTTDFMNIDATLTLLSGSNLTYIMPDATTVLTAQNDGMVRFVEFADTATIINGDSLLTHDSELLMNFTARVNISDGTTINVDLSTDGQNRVQVQGNGQLTYTMNSMSDSRFTGRYTINKGFVRYTPPLMSEKYFEFKEGSYIAFTGDMLNPTLSLYAVDNMRANVTQEGQNSRLVNFDVSLAVTNTLNNMNVAFDLSTPDDITVANELSTMSAEQRANQAMNLLLYNVYTGPGAKGNANLAGNPLYAFLESKVNTWAANNIKFVDISFGIDQYDQTTDGTTSKTTSYSYRVSKTLFNDRFKIIVGGNYSTDAETEDNFAQNLFNDISFEYMLNRSGSMYIKLFRHVGYESILEGEVTQTGVGFVYKRKIHTLRDLFRF